MTVDIVIPFYKAFDTIDRCLASVASQKIDDGDSIKVTIVDDATPDADEHILSLSKRWSGILDLSIVRNDINEGPGTARQIGIEETDGDFIAFVDADDVLGSPFAIRSLLREIVSKNNDIVMGMFIEESPDGKLTNHYENYVWLHGKMFRRRFIDRFNLHFNGTRENEDVGFNQVAMMLTDNISFIPQVVYLWLNQNGSLVRNNHSAYAYGYGWRGFVYNVAWAVEEALKRNVNNGIIRKTACECLIRIYWQQMQNEELYPADDEENAEAVKDYYERAVRPFVIDEAVPIAFLEETYKSVSNECAENSVIPTRSFNEFLREIGFFDDTAKIYKKYTYTEVSENGD